MPVAGDWTPAQLIPDSSLPAALQRAGQHARTLYRVNDNDVALVRQARMWQYISEHGGLRSCCIVPELGRPIWSKPPWIVMPSNGLEFREVFSQSINNISGGPPFDGTDTLIGSWVVQQGYDGLLNRVVLDYEGQSTFQNFSGNIVWRVKVNYRYAKNLGNVQYNYGSLENQMDTPGFGVRLVSGQTVSIFAAIPNGAPINDGIVVAGTFGWTYPRR